MASGGSVLIYGALELYNVLTRVFDQEIMYDESGSDALAFTFKLRCTGFIHGLALANLGVIPTTGDGDAANNYRTIQFLFGPRQHLEYRIGCTISSDGSFIGGVPIIIADPANVPGSTNVNFLDVNNGPKPRVISVTSIASDQAIRVEVEFEISQLRCAADGSTPNNFGVLNNRWSVVDDIDKNFWTTRTWTGTLRASSSQVNVHAFRALCVPPLQSGMRRDRMQFAASEDGLNLRYVITDKETAFAPPKPATTWSARFSEEYQVSDKIGYFSHADITLGGDRYVDKQLLIAIAASMAEAKFQNGVRLAQDNTFYVRHIMVVDEYTDDTSLVHVRATAQRVDTSGNGLLGLNTKFMGRPLDRKIEDVAPGYDSRFSRDGRPGETLEINGPVPMIGAFCSFLQSPCVNNFYLGNGLQVNNQASAPTGGSLPTITAVVNNGITDDGTLKNFGSDNNSGAYESWTMETHEDTDANRVQCPVAVSGSGSSGTTSLGDAWWNGSPPPVTQDTTAIINLAPPSQESETIMEGTRIGSPPAVPAPQDFNGADGMQRKVKYITISSRGLVQTADGKPMYRVRVNIGWWHKAVSMAVKGVSKAFIGLNPWATNRNSQTTVVPEQFNPF